jgi:murein DD-endopeptidase MepM/ murein hydrolase activator NlpD
MRYTLLGLILALCWPALGDEILVKLQGDAIQGGLIFGHTEPGAKVMFNGEQARVSSDGLFLIGFDRDAPPAATLLVSLIDGSSRNIEFEVARREYDIQRIDGLPPAQVTPPPEVLERIRDDGRQVRAARNRDDDRQDFANGFKWPAHGPISGVYGSQRVLNGEARRPHYGVDVAAAEGAPVLAPAAGIVTLAHPDMYFSGGTLIIDHGHGLSSSFLHLSRIDVEVGQSVAAGQQVAAVGATGRVTGAHLDWRMNLGAARIDPQRLVGPMPDL